MTCEGTYWRLECEEKAALINVSYVGTQEVLQRWIQNAPDITRWQMFSRRSDESSRT